MPKAYIKTLTHNETGDLIYPRTLASAVLDTDGTPTIDKVKNSIAANTTAIGAANTANGTNTTKIGTVEGSITTANGKISKNTTDIGTANTALNTLTTTKVDKQTTDIAAVEAAVKENNTTIDAVQDRIYNISCSSITDATEYKRIMKQFFISNGCNALSPVGLTALCERWYNATKTGWSGSTEFYQPDVSSVSTGTKKGMNTNMVCVPSTDTEANQDDYAKLPLFAVTDCNWTIDPETLNVLVTDIDGITGGFERNNINKYVGVMQMTPWHYYDERETTYTHGIADAFEEGHDYCEPVPEAVKPDGTVRSFVVHSKYMSSLISNKMTACAGVIPRVYSFSHNTLQTYSKNNGTGYSGASIMDYAFLQLMTMIKYGSMTLDGIIQGAVNNNKQVYAVAGESNTNRVILSTTDAAYFEVGMSCLVGNYTSSTDRGNAGVYSLSGQNGAIITAIEPVGDNVALVFDKMNDDGAFSAPSWTTAANGNATAGTTIVSTWHWITGSNDSVLGSDGSKSNPGSGKYAGKLQGIEFAAGCYEVMGDVILSEDTNVYTVHICNTRSKQSTSLTANYTNIGLQSVKPASAAWQYIRKLGFAKGVFFGVDTTGGSSSTYTRDAFYKDAASTTGTREWLAFGPLNNGSGYGGLSSLFGYRALSYASWSFGSRLSCNGNRGEFVA